MKKALPVQFVELGVGLDRVELGLDKELCQMRIIIYEEKKKKNTEQTDFIKDKNLDETRETKKKAPELCVCVCVCVCERKSAKESVGVRTPNSDFAFISIHG